MAGSLGSGFSSLGEKRETIEGKKASRDVYFWAEKKTKRLKSENGEVRLFLWQ